jgi:DNA polymerase-3 subunit delta
VYSSLLGSDLREDALLSCYFFFGEETFLADQFVDQLKALLSGSSGEDLHVDRYYLEETKWSEVIDSARTAPFLFQPWRILVVKVPERRPGTDKGSWKRGGPANGEGKGARYLSHADQKIIGDFLAEPPARTVLVVVMPGKVRRNDAAVRFFSSLPKSSTLVREVKPLSQEAVGKWAERRAQTLGKSLTEGAKDRLYEFVGSDLRLLANEIEKLAVFVGEKRGIDEDDVSQATAWVRSYEAYELDDALTGADFEKGIAILGNLFSEGERPEMIVARLTTFFRNVLLAQTWLREKSRDREAIFQTFFPYLQKTHVDLYRRKYGAFFGMVEGLSRTDLNRVLRELQRADIRIKTSDADEKTTLETFLMEYCLMRARKKSTSRD